MADEKAQGREAVIAKTNQTQARTINRSTASENPKTEPTPSPPNPPLEREG